MDSLTWQKKTGTQSAGQAGATRFIEVFKDDFKNLTKY